MEIIWGILSWQKRKWDGKNESPGGCDEKIFKDVF